LRLATSFSLLILLPAIALADPSLDQTKSALAAAQNAAAAHKTAAAAARAKSRSDAAATALLVENQIEAAAKLRRLETLTGGAASGLAALQAQQEQAKAALQKSEAALTSLLPVMQRLSAAPAATLLASPASPTDSVRGILVLQGIAAEIQRQANQVQAQTAIVAHLLAATGSQQQVLEQAVAAQRQAEDALNAQIADARAAEAADADAAARETAAAISADGSVQNLRGIIDRLMAAAKPAPVQTAIKLPHGNAPVAGNLIEAFGDNTIAGPATGNTYKTAPGARVIAPCAGPVQFADHFQSYGLLVIIDCGQKNLFVLSGMSKLDVTAGQRVARGQPVGQMLGYDPKNPARQPLLYEELRQNGAAVDPNIW
jgi:septal ring factor EnvC (AmiA/AmiB activator)